MRYTVIQLLAYSIDMGFFLVILQPAFFNYILANSISKCFAGIFAFVAHRRFTFHVNKKDSTRQQAIRYFLLLIFNIPISSVILALLLLLITNPAPAKLIADIICVFFSYGMSKYCVFINN